jgi:hypothetical protein
MQQVALIIAKGGWPTRKLGMSLVHHGTNPFERSPHLSGLRGSRFASRGITQRFRGEQLVHINTSVDAIWACSGHDLTDESWVTDARAGALR